MSEQEVWVYFKEYWSQKKYISKNMDYDWEKT